MVAAAAAGPARAGGPPGDGATAEDASPARRPVAFRVGPDASRISLFPIFLHERDKGGHETVVMPIGAWREQAGRKEAVLFPLFWYGRDADTTSVGLFPLFAHRRSKRGVSFDAVPPLFLRVAGPRRRFLLAGLWFDYRGPHETRTAGVAPLGVYWRGRERSLLVTPVSYYHHEFASGTRTWVVGPGYFQRFRDGYGAGLAPILFHQRRRTRRFTVVPPVFWYFARPDRGSRTLVAGPYFSHRSPGARARGVAPFYAEWGARGKRPSWNIAAFPLFFWRCEGSRRAACARPLTLGAGPGEKTTFVAGPYYRQRSARRSADIVFPFFGRLKDRRRDRTTVFALPFYYGQWDPERSFHTGALLYWRSRTIDTESTVVFPLFWDFHDVYRSRTTAIFPLGFRHRDEAADATAWGFLPGVYVRRHPRGTDVVGFPLFWRFADGDRKTTVLLPLYWDFARKDAHTRVVFPVYWDFDRKEARTIVVLNTYYRRDKRNGRYDLHVFPFAHVAGGRSGDIRWDVFGGLVGYERQARKRTLRIFFTKIPLEPAPAAAGAPAPERAPKASRGPRPAASPAPSAP